MGMPPATLASMARLILALMARSQISAPHSAISFFIRGYDRFSVGDSPFDNLFCDRRPADKLGNNIHVWIADDLTPVGCPGVFAQSCGEFPVGHRSAANRRDAQPEAQLQGDLIGILGEDGERPRAYISEPDYTYVYIVH